MIFNKRRSDSQMYRAVLDSTGAKCHSFGLYRVPLVTHKTDGRTYCARNTYYVSAANKAAPLFRAVNNPLAARLGGPRLGRTARGWHNWKKAPGKPGRPSLLFSSFAGAKGRQTDGVLGSASFKDRVTSRIRRLSSFTRPAVGDTRCIYETRRKTLGNPRYSNDFRSCREREREREWISFQFF